MTSKSRMHQYERIRLAGEYSAAVAEVVRTAVWPVIAEVAAKQ